MRRRILVLGASGCIGSAIASTLRAHGHQVTEGRRSVVPGSTSQLQFDSRKTSARKIGLGA